MMRGFNDVVGFLLCFCLLHTAYGQSGIVAVTLDENRKGGHQVYSLQLPASNEIYSFFPGQDAESKAALTLFQISERGVITTTKPIFVETGKKNYYDLVAIRRNRGDKEGGVPTSLRITIKDTNNFRPIFPKNTYYGRVKEESPSNTVVMGLENCFAEDRDTVGTITYSITSGNDKGYFIAAKNTVNNRDFLVLKTTNTPIVIDTTPEINLTVRASDGVRSGATKVSITVIDVNNNAPVFEPKSGYTASVSEDTPLLNSVLRVRASDKDHGTNGGIYYYLENSPYFVVDAITGVIKVVRQLPNQAQIPAFNVVAKDRGFPSKSSSVPVNIRINLIDSFPPADNPNPGINRAPVFPEKTYSANVREDFPIGAAILVVHAVDQDPPGPNRRLTYSLSGDSTNAFEIDPNSGVVKLKGQLDYDKKKQYILNVRATDQGVSPQSATAPLTITVQEVDRNRNPPIFQPSNKQQQSVSIQENVVRGTQVGSLITATDADGNQIPDGQVVYSISSGSGLPYFSINQDTGRLVTAAKLDREKQAQYDLLLEARDKALYPLYSHLYLMIDISPAEDNNPTFSQPVYVAKVPEKAPIGTFVTRIHAIDRDGTAVTYSFSIPTNVFQINSQTGVITTSKVLDSASDQTLFTLIVEASAGSTASAGQVNITVVSKQDSPPKFENTPYTATIPENLGQINNLLCIAARDVHGKTVSYSISSNYDGKFSIDSKSGRFSATSSLNYESAIEYPVDVQASNGPQQSDSSRVTIKVTDSKDPPRFSEKKFTFTINEMIPTGTTIVQRGTNQGMVITDEDTQSKQFDCTIENIRDIEIVNHFRVTRVDIGNIGECRLVTQSTFDHSKTPRFTFEVRATDRNNRGMYASAEVEVIIEDTNNHKPEFSQTSYWSSVKETFPAQNSILKVSATDRDSGTFGEIVYELLDANDRNRFSLDPTTGVLSSATSMSVQTYRLRVRASDRAQRQDQVKSSEVMVTVTVYSSASTPVAFDPKPTSYTIAENSNVNTPVFTANAKGPSGISITYEIVGGNEDSAFQVNANSGQVSVKTKESLDREVKESYKLVIRAKASNIAADAEATITLSDQNDESPRITFMELEPKNIGIEDYSPTGAFVIQVFASDRDTNQGGRVTYRMTKLKPEAPFQIDSNTGRITTTKEIRKSAQQPYDIRVRAQDGGGKQSPEYNLRIYVTDGLKAPQLTPTMSAVVYEDQKVGHVFKDISPTATNNNERMYYKYSILSGNTNEAFCVNHAGKVSVAKPLDREKISSYVLKVSASVGNKVSNATLTVSISDRNDDAPHFTKTVYSFDVSEDKGNGQEVGKVSATDRDSGSNGEVKYTLLYAQDKSSPFQVNQQTGSITTTGPLDFEETQQHALFIRADDSGSLPLSSICKVILNVKDINDESPKFSADSYVTKVALDKEIGVQVLLVTATDLDSGENGRVVYNITSGNDEGAFIVDPDTGVIKVKKSLTTVSASQFVLGVEAKDKGNPPRSSRATVKLNVFLPDGPPKFVVKPVIQDVTEGIAANKRVMVVKAATSEALTYEILSGNQDGLFRIVPSTGEILMTRVLDYEEKKQHQLVIRVMDTRDRSDQVTVYLNVKNINDNKPKFPGEVGGLVERKVDEDFRVGDEFARLAAFDGDDGDTITYTLSPNVQSLFSVDKNGVLIAKKARKDISSPVKFEVTAKDSGTPPLETKAKAQLVFVTYRANQQPVRVYQREDKEVGSVVATVPRYFPGGTLSIIFPQNSNFTVDNFGKVRTTAPFDFEQTQFYSLTVREQEPGPGGRTNDVDIEINVVDINDNKPKMTMRDFFGRVNTNSRPGASAYQLKAQDDDGGLAGRVGYQMVSRGIPFGINPLTAVVSTSGVLSENIGSYNVTLFPFDFGIPRQLGNPVYLDIKTVKFKPRFSEAAYKFEVFEKAPPGVIIGKVKATSVSGARVGYSISQGDLEKKFHVDSTGEIKLNSLLDREKKAVYNLKVKAQELIPGGYSNEVEVQVTVKNANEHYPTFSKLVYEKSVDEGAGAGVLVLRVQARDCDCGGCNCQPGLLTFSLEGTSLFRIDPVTGDITVGPNPLDFEKERQHVFTIFVEDFGEKKFKSRAIVRVTVGNRNDEEPQFQESDYNIGIAEDAVTGKALAAILARDADGSKVTYSITSGNSAGIFKIDASSGVLSLLKTVKGSSQTQYTLHIRATDQNSGKYDEVRVVVNIEDSNDNRPVFTNCPKGAPVSVEENRNPGERVIQINAVDNKDRGRNREVEYKLISGGDPKFVIDNTTGLITTVASLDRETKAEHQLIVQAEDGGHGRNEAERLLSYCIFDVKVADRNDNYPKFLTPKYVASVWKEVSVGTTVLTVSAEDDDAMGAGNKDNREVRYQLVNPDDNFRVDEVSGKIITKARLSNFLGLVQLKIRAVNKQPMATSSTEPLDSKTTVEIRVVKLKPPKFTKPVYTASVPENVPLDSAIPALNIHADSQVNSANKISYSLVNYYQEGVQKFKIDPTTANISTASTLDYEQTKQYTLQVRATETQNNLDTTCDVIIKVTDVNDDSPTFQLEEYKARVPENAPSGFNVITIEADDRDTGTSGQVDYFLDSSSLFSVNQNSGDLSTKVTFDREDPSNKAGRYTVTATARDRGNIKPLSTKVTITVSIVDQNDQPPKFAKRRYEANVAEDAAIGTSITDLSASDGDIGDNARLDYFVSSGDSAHNFKMETVYGSRNYGILQLDGKLDYETQKTYTIQVTATDRKDSDTVDVVITVIDTNDNVPQFTELIYEKSILEGSDPGVNVITVSATDADSPNIQSKLKYSLDATGRRYFAINADSGQITTANERLDREKDQIVRFFVFAFDGKHRGQALVRVTLDDKNDNRPYFPNPPYVGYVEENLNPGASVMVLQAVDLDTGVNAEIVYELENNANNKFDINRVSGLVTTRETLERETAVNEFTIRVKATDKGNPALSGSVAATIKVADGNDQSPVFNPTVYNAKVPEDALPGYLVTLVSASDKDVGPNAELEFTIVSGNDPYEFYIDPRTGAILVSGLLDFDQGKKKYNLTVMVSDRGFPPKKADKPAFVYIDVTDANDNPPVFVPAEYNVRVTESLNPGETVLKVTAVDKDTGTNAQFNFAITLGDDADMFGIRPSSNNASIGEIYTILQLDRESVPQYNLTITATDTGGLQGFALVRIVLTDYNDNGPWFKPRYFEGTVKAGTNNQQRVTVLRAYDPDEANNGPPFSFSVETHKDRFDLRENTQDQETTELLFSKGTFNRQAKQMWEVTVKAGDSGSPRQTNTTVVYVQVIDDQNSHEPFNGRLTIIVNAYNGKFSGGVIGTAYYQDNDYGGDKNKYTMASREYFTLNENNGAITAEANIPMNEYTFSIDVEEQKQRSGNFPKTVKSDVTVIVQSVSSAAILQSVAVQILALRLPSQFVGDYYFKMRNVLANILSSGIESDILIFSIQKSPDSRVPIKSRFGLEIQLAVKTKSGPFMARVDVVQRLIRSKQDLTNLGLTIGKIGIDVCAFELQDVGKCINKVEASSQFTVVSGFYGQLVDNKSPSSSLTVVSININLKAQHVSIIPPDTNCSTSTGCLHGGTCHNAVPKGIICECGFDYLGPECQSTTRTFMGNSFIHLEKLAAYERSSVSLQFITGTANGLLLYQGPLFKGANNGLPDVMALMIVEGFVKLVITLGPHPKAPLELYMTKGNRLDDRKWHTVQVIRELKKVTLRIDKCVQSFIVEDSGRIVEDRKSCEITGEIWGSSIYLNGFGPLQIGGVQTALKDLFPKISFGGFKGCIRNIYNNGKMYDLFNPLLQVNTLLGCQLENNACPDCNGKGYCEPRWTNSLCVCDLGYTGPNCNQRTNANWYKANSFTQYKVKQTRRKRRELVPPPVSMANEFYTNIALQIRVSPNSSNVVIFLASNSLGTEFNRIDVKNHVLRYVFRLGDRMKILKIPQLNVTDDKYHTVVVRREGNYASLQIDYDGKVEGTTGGLHKLLNMGGGSFFTGGLPNITEVRVVEAFVNSGGNAILRTADGNVISSGVGSSFGGYSSYGSSGAAFMGNTITVGRGGGVVVSSSKVTVKTLSGMRAVTGFGGNAYIGSVGSQFSTSIGGGARSMKIRFTKYSSTTDVKVIIRGYGIASSGSSSGSRDASGSGGANVSVIGTAYGSGGSGHGSIVTGATVMGGAVSRSAYGKLTPYGTGFGTWTLHGASANDGKAQEVQVIGDFGGCTAANNYNGVDLDNDPNIEARQQNVVFPCPCADSEFCLRGGTCVSAAPPFCLCAPGWTGPRCEDVVTDPKPGTRPGSRWANPAVIACILVIILVIFIIIGAVLLKRRPRPTPVVVVEDGHVHDNIRPYHDEGAGEEDNFGYDISTLMKYTYVENGIGGAGGTGYGRFKNGGAGNGEEEEFTVSESKPLLQGAMPGAGLHHGVTTITKRRVVHPDSIDVKQFIDTRVHEADGEYILSIDELHIYRYEGDDSDVDDLSELGDSDEEPDEEEEQEYAFLQEWGRKFDNLNRIFNED